MSVQVEVGNRIEAGRYSPYGVYYTSGGIRNSAPLSGRADWTLTPAGNMERRPDPPLEWLSAAPEAF
jgi:hypothetical protein